MDWKQVSSTWVSDLQRDLHGKLNRERAKTILPVLQAAIASGNYEEVAYIMTRPKYPKSVRQGLRRKYVNIAVMKRLDIIRGWGAAEAVRELAAISRGRGIPKALRSKAMMESIPLLEKLASREADVMHLSILASMGENESTAVTPEIKQAAAEALGRVLEARSDMHNMRERHSELVRRTRKDQTRPGRRLRLPAT